MLPTRPRTSSMSGTRIPITRQIKMTAAVIMLNLEEKRTKCVFFPNDREPGRRDVVVYQFGRTNALVGLPGKHCER